MTFTGLGGEGGGESKPLGLQEPGEVYDAEIFLAVDLPFIYILYPDAFFSIMFCII